MIQSNRWNSRSFSALVVVLLGAMIVLAGCGSDGPELPESYLKKIPKDVAVVRLKNEAGEVSAEVSGAWLINWVASYELNFMRQGIPVSPSMEYELLLQGQQLLRATMVVALEAERLGLTVDDEKVQESIAAEMALFESTEVWRKQLEDSGLTPDKRRKQLRWELLRDTYRDEILAPVVREKRANESEARRYYEKFPDVFEEEATVHVFHFLRSIAKDAPEDQRERERRTAVEARERILAGESFADVARELSTDTSALKGGDIGVVMESLQFDPELKSVIFGLAEGELSEVIESPQGYHLFKATEVKPRRKRSFEEAKEEIMQRLFDQAIKLEMTRVAAELVMQAQPESLDLAQIIGPPPTPPGGTEGAAPGAPAPAADAAPAE